MPAPLIKTSLVVQWMGICLLMQATQIRFLVWKIPHALEQLSPYATTTESELWRLRAGTTEALVPRICTP